MRKVFAVVAILAAFCLAGATAAVAGPNANAKPISMGTGPTTGGYYFVGAAIAEVFAKYNQDFTITTEATGGTPENIGLCNQEAVEMAMANAGDVADAIAGVGPYKGRMTPNVRIMMAGHKNYVQFITMASSDVKSFADIKGKKIGYNVGANIMHKTFDGAFGWKEGVDFKCQFAPQADNSESIKDGQIAAFGFDAAKPNSTVADLATTHNIRLLPMPQDLFTKIHAKYPFFIYDVIPAGTYNGVNEDVPCLSVPALIITYANADEEFVYQMTKLLNEHADEVAKIIPAGAEYKKETALSAFDHQYLHPGARKYYEEAGMLK